MQNLHLLRAELDEVKLMADCSEFQRWLEAMRTMRIHRRVRRSPCFEEGRMDLILNRVRSAPRTYISRRPTLDGGDHRSGGRCDTQANMGLDTDIKANEIERQRDAEDQCRHPVCPMTVFQYQRFKLLRVPRKSSLEGGLQHGRRTNSWTLFRACTRLMTPRHLGRCGRASSRGTAST